MNDKRTFIVPLWVFLASASTVGFFAFKATQKVSADQRVAAALERLADRVEAGPR